MTGAPIPADPLTVAAGERGLVRVFALDPGLPEEGPAAPLLGLTHLDEGQVDRVTVADLGEIGLAGFLEEGHGIAAATLEPALERLAAVTGAALVVRSAAFEGQSVDIRPQPGVRLVGVFSQDAPPPPALQPPEPEKPAMIGGGRPADLAPPPDGRSRLGLAILAAAVVLALALIALAIR